MRPGKKPALLVVYGEGGHQNQMNRLLQRMPEVTSSNLEIVAITEGEAIALEPVDKMVNCGALRSKQSGFEAMMLARSLIRSFFLLIKLFSAYDIRTVLSTGPGLAAPVAFWSRLFGKTVIHVETFSRFYSASMTAKVLYKLASVFYVQNKELLKLFPKAKWSGRL